MKFQNILLLSIILAVGIFFRLYNVHWDTNFHLHPDERFLTMIGLKETLPISFTQYLNPDTSPFNPFVLGFGFFVYGVLPLTFNTLIALFTHSQLYDAFTIQGRILSGCFDVLALFLVYMIAALLEREFHLSEKVKFFSAFFYAISVLPIQLSHFFTVDIFLSFFILLSVYFALRFTMYKSFASLLCTGIALGMAIACKVNALAGIPLIIILLFLPYFQKKRVKKAFFLSLAIFLITTYCTLRISDPYLFASGNFFDPHINNNFLQSIKSLAYYGTPGVWYPPNVQWANKLPVIFSLFNIAFYGLGIGMFIFMTIGIVSLFKTKKVVALALIVWVILFFFYQSVQYVKTMRYFIFLYPFFAFFAGIGYAEFIRRKPHVLFILLSILLIVIWPLSFLSIYTKPHTRVTATQWILTNIPKGSIVLGEYWDDPLPLSHNEDYTVDLLHVFDPDSQQKWITINDQLQRGEYLVLSSNRGWGSISSDPKEYPAMSMWYKNLFAGKLPYKKVAEFSSFPSLSYLGIPFTIHDDIAEEAFTVYDHPVVLIFKNESHK